MYQENLLPAHVLKIIKNDIQSIYNVYYAISMNHSSNRDAFENIVKEALSTTFDRLTFKQYFNNVLKIENIHPQIQSYFNGLAHNEKITEPIVSAIQEQLPKKVPGVEKLISKETGESKKIQRQYIQHIIVSLFFQPYLELVQEKLTKNNGKNAIEHLIPIVNFCRNPKITRLYQSLFIRNKCESVIHKFNPTNREEKVTLSNNFYISNKQIEQEIRNDEFQKGRAPKYKEHLYSQQKTLLLESIINIGLLQEERIEKAKNEISTTNIEVSKTSQIRQFFRTPYTPEYIEKREKDLQKLQNYKQQIQEKKINIQDHFIDVFETFNNVTFGELHREIIVLKNEWRNLEKQTESFCNIFQNPEFQKQQVILTTKLFNIDDTYELQTEYGIAESNFILLRLQNIILNAIIEKGFQKIYKNVSTSIQQQNQKKITINTHKKNIISITNGIAKIQQSLQDIEKILLGVNENTKTIKAFKVLNKNPLFHKIINTLIQKDTPITPEEFLKAIEENGKESIRRYIESNIIS